MRRLFLALLLLGGCSGADAPSASWEMAAQGFYAAAISDNGDMAVIGSMNHGASMWRLSDHERLYNWAHESGEFAELVAADFSPDGSTAVTTDPRTLVMWNTGNGQALNFWATPGVVLDVAVMSDNRHVLMGLDNHSALLFDAVNGDYKRTMLHQGEVTSVALDAAGDTALTGSDDYTAALWRLADGSAIHTFKHDNPVRCVALSPGGRYSFSAAQGDLVGIWDNTTGDLLHELHNGINHGVMTARFSEDERQLLIGYANRKIALYDVTSGRRLQTWDPGTRHAMRASGAAIIEVAFSDTAALWALAGDGRLLRLRRS